MTTKLRPAGYIVYDRAGYMNAIMGLGATEAEARANAMQYLGPWEDSDGNTVSPDHPDFGFDAHYAVAPATAALLAEPETDSWRVVEGIYCTRDEAADHSDL
jgi:hypothetical protein